jgi:hypothetical protein
MKPNLWYIDIQVSYLPLPYEIQSKIFKCNRRVAFTDRISRLDSTLRLEPMVIWKYLPHYNKHHEICIRDIPV